MKTPKTAFADLFKKARKDPRWKVKGAILDFTETMAEQMDTMRINKSELARRIGSSPAYVTKILRGNSNFTLESMVKIAAALNGELRITIEPKIKDIKWFKLLENAYMEQSAKEPAVCSLADRRKKFRVVKPKKSKGEENVKFSSTA